MNPDHQSESAKLIFAEQAFKRMLKQKAKAALEAANGIIGSTTEPGWKASRQQSQTANAVSAAVAAHTARSLELTKIAAQAAKLGVNFDLQAALSGTVTASAAREAVMNAAADADDLLDVSPICGITATEQAYFDRAKAGSASAGSGWDNALERAAARGGFAPINNDTAADQRSA